MIQTYLNDPQEKSGEFFLMQAEVAAAVRLAKCAFAASFGIKRGPNDVRERHDVVSRVHYALFNPTETTGVRVGRFMPQYGINEPNHAITTRQGLGFN